MPDLEEFKPNPHAADFAGFGVLYVRWGKAKGSPPRRRSTLTVFPWTVDVISEWVSTYRALLDTAARSSAL